MKSAVISFIILFLSITPNAMAEQYAYEAVCQPTQDEDIGRVIQGRIYLALRSDSSISKFSVSAKVSRVKPYPVVTVKETDLLSGLGFAFNTGDLSLGLGGNIVGHSCWAQGLLTVRIRAVKKDGTQLSNDFSTPIGVPGAYATKGKTKIPSPE